MKLRVVIYCPPCLHLIATAERIATYFRPALYRRLIKIDGTIPVGCCPRLSVASALRNLNDGSPASGRSPDLIDTVWIESEIADYNENGGPAEFDPEARCKNVEAGAIIILGEPSLFQILSTKFSDTSETWNGNEAHWIVKDEQSSKLKIRLFNKFQCST